MSLELCVDPKKCIHCGRCVTDCNPQSLELDSSTRLPKWRESGEERCFKCQHCIAICPTGAISIMGRDPAKSAEKSNTEIADELLNLIQCRRSCRSYHDVDVDRRDMEKLKAMLAWSPTGVNDHRLFFGFIDDAKVMKKFRRGFLETLVKLLESNAPGAERFARYRQRLLQGEDVIFRGAPHMVLVCTPATAPCADIDPIIALSYFELYANSLGLGTLWCGLFKWALSLMPDFINHFNVPAGYVPGYAMMFGKTGLNYVRSTQPDPVLMSSVVDVNVD